MYIPGHTGYLPVVGQVVDESVGEREWHIRDGVGSHGNGPVTSIGDINNKKGNTRFPSNAWFWKVANTAITHCNGLRPKSRI